MNGVYFGMIIIGATISFCAFLSTIGTITLDDKSGAFVISLIIFAISIFVMFIGINNYVNYDGIAYNQCVEQGYSEIMERGNGYYCLRFGLEPEMIYLTSIDDMQSDLQKGE